MLFSNSCLSSVRFDEIDTRKHLKIVKGKKVKTLPIFEAKEAVTGTVNMVTKRAFDHQGIMAELIGIIEFNRESKLNSEIVRLKQMIAEPGHCDIDEEQNYTFNFDSNEKVNETYTGVNVSLRYMIRLSIVRPHSGPFTHNTEFAVQQTQAPPTTDLAIKDDVGVEDTIHIDFQYNKSKYSLDDVILGKIFFIVCRVHLKTVELVLVRRETCNTGTEVHNDTQTVLKYELVDGSPTRGETIPIRLFLKGHNLTPTYSNVNNRFNVRYFLILSMVDETGHRCYNQQEITFYRAAEK